MQGKLIVCGDLGGTNTRLLYASQINLDYDIIASKQYLNSDYESFEQILNDFISEFVKKESIDIACFAIAGPVLNGEVSLTNIDWRISESSIRTLFHIPTVKILNDFSAIAYVVSELETDQYVNLQKGSMPEDGEAVIVGAGTGLGCCHVINLNGDIFVKSSEVGHSHFSPVNQQEVELLEWMWAKQPEVSIEHLVSGRGLGMMYQFLKQSLSEKEDIKIKKLMQSIDPAAVITEYADRDVLCNETIRLFIRLYGTAVSDIVLHYMPVSRVFIAGGIAAKINQYMKSGLFIETFSNNQKMNDLLRRVNVDLILDEYVGLKGAMKVAVNL